MSTLIKTWCHKVPTWRLYPRVSFFWKRYKDLLPRFKKITDAFPASFLEDDLLKDIYNIKEDFDHAFGIVVFGYDTDSLEVGDIVVTLKPLQEEHFNEPISSAVITAYVCYIKIDQIDDIGLQRVSSSIDYFYNEHGRSDLRLFDNLFIVVDISSQTPSAPDELLFKNKILSKVQTWYPVWQDTDKILFESKNGQLCNKVSEWLEAKIVSGFHKVFNQLEMFIRHEKLSLDFTLLENIQEKEHLSNFLRSMNILKEIQQVASADDSAEMVDKTINEKFVHHLIKMLAVLVKCHIVSLATDKYNLVAWQVNMLLHELKFEEVFIESLSDNTRYQLLTLNDVINRKVSRHKLWRSVCDPISYSIVNDIEKCVSDVENKLRYMVSVVTVMEKMMFEIEGYLSATITEVYTPKSVPPNVPDKLRIDLLGLDNVFAVGTVYNKLEVHVQRNTPAIRENIAKLIQRHMFSWQYIVKPVNQNIQIMGGVMHENGDMIKCPHSRHETARYHTGTVGCFAEGDDNKLYGLTAAHVVSNIRENSCKVYVCDKSSQLHEFGESKRDLTVSSGQSPSPLIDIAAIQIHNCYIQSCIRLLKDDCGFNRQSFIATENLSDLVKTFVYKHGAVSELTQGIICSTDLTVVGNNDYLVMIENLAMQEEPFAVPGDSGSVICCPDINTDKIKLISMLTGGDYKVGGDKTPRYLSFSLKHGLKHLSGKSGVSFSVR